MYANDVRRLFVFIRVNTWPDSLAVREGQWAMRGIRFVIDASGRRVAIIIDLKKHGSRLQDFFDGVISESRRKEKGIPFEKVKADLVKRRRVRPVKMK